jgi:hypothetical protein
MKFFDTDGNSSFVPIFWHEKKGKNEEAISDDE